MNNQNLAFDEKQTAALLDYKSLVDVLRAACMDYEDGRITSPPRLIMNFGPGGTMLSMPAAATDIAAHKLVNVCPGNRALGLPTIHASVSAYDVDTGAPLFMLDGSTVTARRTAAISALAVQSLLPAPPGTALLFGVGKQATQHVQALTALFPGLPILVRGRTEEAAEAFCAGLRSLNPNVRSCPTGAIPSEVDVVITTTTSRTPVYQEPAKAGRLIVAVGSFKPDAAEIGGDTVRASALFVDDPAGAHHEAGDMILAGIDWADVRSLASAMRQPVDFSRPIFFKSVGCAAWDLAACRLARQVLQRDGRI